MSKPIGPNVKKLIIRKMSLDAIPPGGGFQDGIEFLASNRLAESGRNAAEWVQQALAVFKTAPDNPYGDDDEAIAGELLRRIEEMQKTK